MCRNHLDKHGLLQLTEIEYAEMKKRAANGSKRFVSQLEVINLLTHVSCDHHKAKSSHSKLKMINFDDPRMSENDYVVLTGVKKVQFDALVHEQDHLRDSKEWSRRNSIGLYLTRLRTGNLSQFTPFCF